MVKLWVVQTLCSWFVKKKKKTGINLLVECSTLFFFFFCCNDFYYYLSQFSPTYIPPKIANRQPNKCIWSGGVRSATYIIPLCVLRNNLFHRFHCWYCWFIYCPTYTMKNDVYIFEFSIVLQSVTNTDINAFHAKAKQTHKSNKKFIHFTLCTASDVLIIVEFQWMPLSFSLIFTRRTESK